jgi:DNA uptake protein ComE-like DNA-binding protein
VLAYRERMSGYESVDDLDKVPGFPQDFLDEFKLRVTV